MASIFAVILVVLSVACGLIWLLDVKVFAPKRELALQQAEAQLGGELDEEAREKILRQPFLAETAQSIFPVVLAITVFRSFIYEPFQIPSGSMKPTLLDGDFILVEKFAYGIKDPVTRTTLIDTGSPQRGDVAVFKYPEDPMLDYIKRVVGLPGDTIIYTKEKTLKIKPSCEREPDNCQNFIEIKQKVLEHKTQEFSPNPLTRSEEDLLGIEHEMLVDPDLPAYVRFKQNGRAPGQWLVPEGHYFMVGDNRDNSQDSRFWGFVPEGHFVGRAVLIWTSFEYHRQPDSWIPGFIPTGVRFERLGSFK